MLRIRLFALLAALMIVATPATAAPLPKPGDDERPWSNLAPLTPPPAGGAVSPAALVLPATITATVSPKVPSVRSFSEGGLYCDATDCRAVGYDKRLYVVAATGTVTNVATTGIDSDYDVYMLGRSGSLLIGNGGKTVGDEGVYGIYRSIDKGLTWSWASMSAAVGSSIFSPTDVECLSGSVCLMIGSQEDPDTGETSTAVYRTADKGVTWTKASLPVAIGYYDFACVPGTGCLLTGWSYDEATDTTAFVALTSSAAASSWTKMATAPAVLEDRDALLCDTTGCAAITAVPYYDAGADATTGHFEIHVATTSFATWTKRPDITTVGSYPEIGTAVCSPLLCAFTSDDYYAPMAVRAAGAAGTWAKDTVKLGLTKTTDTPTVLGCTSTFCVTSIDQKIERMVTPRTTPVRTLIGADLSYYMGSWSCADATAAAALCLMETYVDEYAYADDQIGLVRSVDGYGTVEFVSFPSTVTDKFKDLRLYDCPDSGCLFAFSTKSDGGRTAIYRTTNGTTFTIVSGSKAFAGLARSMSCSGKVCTVTHNSSKFLRSVDAGLTWKMSATGPDDGLLTIAACGGTTCLSIPVEEDELYRSADAGVTWSELSLSGIAPSGYKIDSIGHAGCSTGLKACFVMFGLYNESTEDWLSAYYRVGATGNPTAITAPGYGYGYIAGGAGTVLLFADGYDLFRSTNSGASWTNVSSGLSGKFDLEAYFWTASWSGTKASIFGVNGATGLLQVFRSTDGLTWTKGAGSSSQ